MGNVKEPERDNEHNYESTNLENKMANEYQG